MQASGASQAADESARAGECRRALETARRAVAHVRRQLGRPTAEVFGSCAAPLARAISDLEFVQAALQSGVRGSDRVGLRIEMLALRRELSQVNALMLNASNFYRVWGALLAAESDPAPAYAPAHQRSPAPAAPRFTVHG